MGTFKLYTGIFEQLTTAPGNDQLTLTRVETKYGKDFTAFLYRPRIDEILKDDLLLFLEPRETYNGFFDNDHWQQKHPFNFPGPFYTGESDSCCTGDAEAPDNVMYDENGYEYIFKQPKNFEQLLGVVGAAAVEVFDGYSCNGNQYWTYALCKEWWQNMGDMIAQLNSPEVKKVNGDRIQLYLSYLSSEAELDLRRYCFFLENNYYPADDYIRLPLL